MKKAIAGVFLVLFMAVFIGCGGSQNTASKSAEELEIENIMSKAAEEANSDFEKKRLAEVKAEEDPTEINKGKAKDAAKKYEESKAKLERIKAKAFPRTEPVSSPGFPARDSFDFIENWNRRAFGDAPKRQEEKSGEQEKRTENNKPEPKLKKQQEPRGGEKPICEVENKKEMSKYIEKYADAFENYADLRLVNDLNQLFGIRVINNYLRDVLEIDDLKLILSPNHEIGSQLQRGMNNAGLTLNKLRGVVAVHKANLLCNWNAGVPVTPQIKFRAYNQLMKCGYLNYTKILVWDLTDKMQDKDDKSSYETPSLVRLKDPNLLLLKDLKIFQKLFFGQVIDKLKSLDILLQDSEPDANNGSKVLYAPGKKLDLHEALGIIELNSSLKEAIFNLKSAKYKAKAKEFSFYDDLSGKEKNEKIEELRKCLNGDLETAEKILNRRLKNRLKSLK